MVSSPVVEVPLSSTLIEPPFALALLIVPFVKVNPPSIYPSAPAESLAKTLIRCAELPANTTVPRSSFTAEGVEG